MKQKSRKYKRYLEKEHWKLNNKLQHFIEEEIINYFLGGGVGTGAGSGPLTTIKLSLPICWIVFLSAIIIPPFKKLLISIFNDKIFHFFTDNYRFYSITKIFIIVINCSSIFKQYFNKTIIVDIN